MCLCDSFFIIYMDSTVVSQFWLFFFILKFVHGHTILLVHLFLGYSYFVYLEILHFEIFKF